MKVLNRNLVLNFRWPDKARLKFQKICEKEGRSMSQQARLIIEEWMKNER